MIDDKLVKKLEYELDGAFKLSHELIKKGKYKAVVSLLKEIATMEYKLKLYARFGYSTYDDTIKNLYVNLFILLRKVDDPEVKAIVELLDLLGESHNVEKTKV